VNEEENFRLLFLCFFFLFEMFLLYDDQLLMKYLAGMFYLFTLELLLCLFKMILFDQIGGSLAALAREERKNGS